MKILFVDDYVETAESLAELTRLLGHDTRTAASGIQATGMALEWLPDLIFLDIWLGAEDGRELCRTLRAASSLKHCRFVALTGASAADLVCEAGLFDATVSKPIDLESLENVIKRTSSAAG